MARLRRSTVAAVLAAAVALIALAAPATARPHWLGWLDSSRRHLMQLNATTSTEFASAATPADARASNGFLNVSDPNVTAALNAISVELDAPVLYGLLNYSATVKDQDLPLHQAAETAYVLYNQNRPTPLLLPDLDIITNQTLLAQEGVTGGVIVNETEATSGIFGPSGPPVSEDGNATAPILIDLPALIRLLESAQDSDSEDFSKIVASAYNVSLRVRPGPIIVADLVDILPPREGNVTAPPVDQGAGAEGGGASGPAVGQEGAATTSSGGPSTTVEPVQTVPPPREAGNAPAAPAPSPPPPSP